MLLSANVKRKIFTYMALAGLVPLLVLSFQNHYFGKKAIEKLEVEHLDCSLKSRMLWLLEWTRHSKKEFFRVGSIIASEDDRISRNDPTSSQIAVEGLFKGHSKYKSLTVYNQNWSIIRQFEERPDDVPPPPSDVFKKKFITPDLLLMDKQYQNAHGDIILPLGQTVLDRDGHPIAYIIAEMNITESLKRVLADTSDLDTGGKMYLATGDGSLLYHTSPTPCEDSSLGIRTVSADLLQEPYWSLRKRTDSEGVSVFSVAAPIPEMGWILIVEVDEMHAMREIEKYMIIGSGTALAILIVILIHSWSAARSVADPLDEFSRVALGISAGNHQERLPVFKDQYLNNLGEAFNLMLDTLEENKKSMIQATSLSLVGKLSSSIVHEMRNPLSSVKINLQALARKVKDDPSHAEMAAIALTQTKRLESMFSDLLNFSKPIHLQLEKTTFQFLADEARKILVQKANDKEILLEIIDNLGNTLLKVDKKHIVLALVNLVANGIQWSRNGSLVQIIGDQLPDSKDVTITVKDRGPGLREDQMNNLFQPFYSTSENGTGLGLANVKKIVEFHGGTVLAGNNSDDGGAQFSMIFKGIQN